MINPIAPRAPPSTPNPTFEMSLAAAPVDDVGALALLVALVTLEVDGDEVAVTGLVDAGVVALGVGTDSGTVPPLLRLVLLLLCGTLTGPGAVSVLWTDSGVCGVVAIEPDFVPLNVPGEMKVSKG